MNVIETVMRKPFHARGFRLAHYSPLSTGVKAENDPMEKRTVCLAMAMAVAALIGLTACDKQASSERAPRPQASIQDLMAYQVAPSAQRLWDATGVVMDEKGTHELGPKTEQDWLVLRQSAIDLIEAPNLLAMDRPLLHPGAKLDGEGDAGSATRAEIQARLDKDRPEFLARARELQLEALKALDAIDRRDRSALEQSGSRLDEVCESCHTKFWYPDEK